MADKEEIDQLLIDIVFSNFEELNDIRVEAQEKATEDFLIFQNLLNDESSNTNVTNTFI